MYNYNNLSDVEFENLCKDIMKVKLGVELRTFARGADGGIDISDNEVPRNIIVQVKHYKLSTFPVLYNALKNEVHKISKLKPNSYYLCISKELTPQNILDIYELFDEYMSCTENIVTLTEIDDLLQREQYHQIVRKHHKLWLYSSNILSTITNQNVFVDCDTLLFDIEKESELFISTTVYLESINILEKERAIMLLGDPGVGKTLTSKMLILFFCSKGYRVRYATNGSLSNIKNALSSNRDDKEIVLLDDCLGQHYFSMRETQENELTSLLKFIKMNPNKLIVLNSRITIFNEAKSKGSDFSIYLNNKNIKISIMDMNQITLMERALIFYSHLKSRKIPSSYYDEICKNRNYYRIVNHSNYIPRVIEYITSPNIFDDIEPKKYLDFIVKNLNEPYEIWKNEFEYRLKEVDRIFMYTLFSLTDTNIRKDILRECFNERLINNHSIDTSINQFHSVMVRLNNSLVKVFDSNGTPYVGVHNPSINDYMKSVLFGNSPEVDEIRLSIKSYLQISRCYNFEETEFQKNKIISNHTVENLIFENDFEKNHFILSCICNNQIYDSFYEERIHGFFRDIQSMTFGFEDNYSSKEFLSSLNILKCLIEPAMVSFYNTIEYFFSKSFLEKACNYYHFEEIDHFISSVYSLINIFKLNKELKSRILGFLLSIVNETINFYIEDVDVSRYYEYYDFAEILEKHMVITDDNMPLTDYNSLEKYLFASFTQDVIDEIIELNKSFPEELKEKIVFDQSKIFISESTIEDLVNSFMEGEYNDVDYEYLRLEKEEDTSYENLEIDFLFNND